MEGQPSDASRTNAVKYLRCLFARSRVRHALKTGNDNLLAPLPCGQLASSLQIMLRQMSKPVPALVCTRQPSMSCFT
jgi:hypothetical protein